MSGSWPVCRLLTGHPQFSYPWPLHRASAGLFTSWSQGNSHSLKWVSPFAQALFKSLLASYSLMSHWSSPDSRCKALIPILWWEVQSHFANGLAYRDGKKLLQPSLWTNGHSYQLFNIFSFSKYHVPYARTHVEKEKRDILCPQEDVGLPWWLNGKESACQCRRLRFAPRSGTIPHAVEQLNWCATTIWPVL